MYSLPPVATRAGDFSQIVPGTMIRDPLTGQPFPNNMIPAARLSPTSQKLLEFYPAHNVAGGRLASNYLALGQ